jgi:hypothetical protein
VNTPGPAPHAANTTPAPSCSAGRTGFLDKQRAARWASVSMRTLDRWIANGLPVYRSGPRAKPLVRPADIEAFLVREQTPRADLNDLVDETLGELLTKTRSAAQGFPAQATLHKVGEFHEQEHSTKIAAKNQSSLEED